MTKKLTILCSDHSTYAIHLEVGEPPRKVVGGQSLDVERLKTELLHHGCSQEKIATALQDLESKRSATIML